MITDLGIEVIKFARELEEYIAIKKGKLYVRTSRFSIEEFNKEKIINSLTTEANIPYDLAEEIATEAEERLIQLKTTYLTAPLIREFVNAILIEKGLDEYRHKLTRLGMPIYDVYQLFKTTGQKGFNVEKIIYASGSSVIEEFALLTSLPRDIADSHLSGSLHITDLNYWPLKPNEVVHDIRFFFKNGLSDLRNFKTFEGALEALRMIYLATKAESYGEQSIDMFNIFLAPFIEKIDKAIADLQNGKFILIYDDDSREGETDLVIASEFVTHDSIKTMRKDGGGLIFLMISKEVANKLKLPFLADMYSDIQNKYPVLKELVPNDIPYDTKSSFSLYINHRETFTGITDNDRSLTMSKFAELTKKIKEISEDPAVQIRASTLF